MKKSGAIVQAIVARAVVIQRGKILLSKAVGKKWYFLPGGHVEKGEFVLDALDRELREELGVGLKTSVFLGIHDNRFLDSKTGVNQELGIIFSVHLRGNPNDRESHIATEWVPISQLSRITLMPKGLGKRISSWTKDKRAFWMVNSD